MTPFLQDNVVFREVYCFLGGNEGNAGWCGGDGICCRRVSSGRRILQRVSSSCSF